MTHRQRGHENSPGREIIRDEWAKRSTMKTERRGHYEQFEHFFLPRRIALLNPSLRVDHFNASSGMGVVESYNDFRILGPAAPGESGARRDLGTTVEHFSVTGLLCSAQRDDQDIFSPLVEAIH